MLVGLREDAVRATLEAAGLVPGLRRGAFHPTTPLGEVIDQSPLAGAELLPGGAVDYTVSAGPRPVAVPMLVGLREDAVRATLEAAGLAPGLRRGAFHPTTPLGEVIDQSTPAGAELLPGGAVDYTVSAGPRPVAVPMLVGLREDAVRATWRPRAWCRAAARRVPPHDAAGRGHRPVTPRGRGAAARRGRGLHRLGRPPTGGSGRLAMSVASSPGPTTPEGALGDRIRRLAQEATHLAAGTDLEPDAFAIARRFDEPLRVAIAGGSRRASRRCSTPSSVSVSQRPTRRVHPDPDLVPARPELSGHCGAPAGRAA